MENKFNPEDQKRINEMGVALLAAKKQISDIRQKQGALMKEIQTRPRMDNPKNRAKLHEYGREVVKIERGVVALAIRDAKSWTPEERAIIEAALQIGGWSWAEIVTLRQVLEKM